MSILYDRIHLLCLTQHITINKVETLAKLSLGSVRYWNDAMPSGDKILRVANVFDVSVDYLLGNTDNPQSHKTELPDMSAAVEISKAVTNLSASISTSLAQADEHIQNILKLNGVTPAEDE